MINYLFISLSNCNRFRHTIELAVYRVLQLLVARHFVFTWADEILHFLPGFENTSLHTSLQCSLTQHSAKKIWYTKLCTSWRDTTNTCKGVKTIGGKGNGTAASFLTLTVRNCLL